jgi:two-component system, sensor histidine kinase
MVVVVLYALALQVGFPRRVVASWALLALACNVLRLVTRWRYFRQPAASHDSVYWSRWFVAVSALTGLSWGAGAWLFSTPSDSIYRVLTVLVLAGITSGASRLLAPVFAANVTYLWLAMVPLSARLAINPDTRSLVLSAMAVLYLGYMTVAARQQLRALHRSVRLGYENTALVDSLRLAKDRAEQLNQDLSGEISRREVVEQELRSVSDTAVAASRAKSEFLATMSHEIRTPMNGIIGMLRIVRDTPLTDAQRDQIETAAASADALHDLLNDILDFSKIEAGRLELERIAFSTASIVNGVAALLRPRARDKALELRVDIDPRVPVGVFGDPNRLRQVLFNLLGNAIKFTDRGSVAVRLGCEASDHQNATLHFAVSDTGIGIEPGAVERLFTPFTQADSSMSRRFGGSGLGLAISQSLVEAMGGKISVDSRREAGSTFQFTVRLARADSAANVAPAIPYAAPRLRGRVLVVEDDRVNQRVVGHFLKQMGLTFGVAEDGATAVDIAVREPWDAILMDYQLPGLDGLEATRRIRVRCAGRPLPIIAITANASMQDRAACLAAGMDDFLTKPIRVEALAGTLTKWLPAADPVPSEVPAAVKA